MKLNLSLYLQIFEKLKCKTNNIFREACVFVRIASCSCKNRVYEQADCSRNQTKNPEVISLKMNELPAHVLLKILDSLPSVDAIRCRVVCKSWLALIDRFVLDELNVFYGQRQCTKYYQFRKCFMNPKRSISFDGSFYGLVTGNQKFDYLFRNLKRFAFQEDYCRQHKKYPKLEKLISACQSCVWHTLLQCHCMPGRFQVGSQEENLLF